MESNSLAIVAFQALYPNNAHLVSTYTFSLTYSYKFKAYNANIKYFPSRNIYQFSLSKEWQEVSSEITIGIIQHLMIKAFKNKLTPISNKTLNIELYDSFLKKVGNYTKKTKIDKSLKEVFDKINLEYFEDPIEYSNLVWGSKSIRTLGHYSYGSDTITISTILKPCLDDSSILPFLELVMYHEMLHKKHKYYSTKTGKNFHHTSAFKNDESKFKNYKTVEKDLKRFLSTKRIQKNPSKSTLRSTFFNLFNKNI